MVDMNRTADDRIQDRIRNMLAKAQDPRTPQAEREMCYDRANALMLKHAIDQATLEMGMAADERATPIVKHFRMPASELEAKWATVVSNMARTFRCRMVYRTKWETDYNDTYYEYELVGFPADVAFIEDMSTSAYFTFVGKLYPVWSNSTSFEDNVHTLKEAGFKWGEINKEANAHGHYVPTPDGGVLIRAYKKQCRILNVEPTPHTQRNTAYRESFADGFISHLCTRLEIMRHANDKELESTGKDVVLLDRTTQVDARFFELYPDRDPAVADVNHKKWLKEAELAAKEEAEHRERMLAAMTDAQRARFFRKEEEERAKQEKRDDKYWRKHEKEYARKYDGAGASAGRKAADAVDLSRSTRVAPADTGRAIT